MFTRSTRRKKALTCPGGSFFSGSKTSLWIKSLQLPLIIASYLLLPLAHASDSMAANRLTIESAVEIAVRDNPNLAQLQERYRALAEIPSQVGSLPDPMINFNAMNFPVPDFHRRQEPMTQVQIGFVQAFPFPGKLGLKKALSWSMAV